MKSFAKFAPLVWGVLAVMSYPVLAKPAKPAPQAAEPKAALTPEPTVALTQEEVGRRAIQGILRDTPIDSLKQYFEEGSHDNLTPEVLEGFKGQIGWLPRFIGDSVEVFMTGWEVPDPSGRTAFFREYRFANESAKRAPLMLVHLYFADSTILKISGAFNKTFDDDTRNRIGNAQVWETPSGKIDVHSVTYVEIDNKLLPIVRIYDEDTTELDSLGAIQKTSPAAREAIARGFLPLIQNAKPGMPFMHRFGVSLIRRDPHRGYTQVPIVLFPSSYGGEEDTVKAGPAAPAPSTKKPKAGTKAKKAK